MAKGRKRGCPVSVRDWLIYILNPADSEFVRIYGLTSMTHTVDGDTEDGSADTEDWAEPYVTKRNGSLTLEGNEVVEASTGTLDEGQELLDSYANATGCDGDATLKLVDPYGHAIIADFVVTSREISADDSGNTKSWDLEQVGEAEAQAYVQVVSIALKDGDTSASTLALTMGGAAKIITVAFTPADASNQRFRVTNTKRSVCAVSNITSEGFTVTPTGVGTSTITVTTVNGGKTASLAVTVTAGT